MSPHLEIRVANVQVSHHVRRVPLKLERLRELRNGFRVTALGSVCESEIRESVGIIGFDFKRFVEVLYAGVVLPDSAALSNWPRSLWTAPRFIYGIG